MLAEVVLSGSCLVAEAALSLPLLVVGLRWLLPSAPLPSAPLPAEKFHNL